MLQKIRIQPGFNKQVTATGGEGQWYQETMFVLDMAHLKK